VEVPSGCYTTDQNGVSWINMQLGTWTLPANATLIRVEVTTSVPTTLRGGGDGRQLDGRGCLAESAARV